MWSKPIEVVGYDPTWPVLFAEIAECVQAAFGGDSHVHIEHVGSTAIPGLAAKPIIDILVSVTPPMAASIPALETRGYDCRGECGIPGRLFFRKGLIEFKRTHHLHLIEAGHGQWLSMLGFRDYLRCHPGDARRYEDLKRALAEKFQDNRRAYTKGKAEFIQAILAKAEMHPD